MVRNPEVGLLQEAMCYHPIVIAEKIINRKGGLPSAGHLSTKIGD